MLPIIGNAASSEAAHNGSATVPPSTELILDALPEVESPPYRGEDLQSGVSTKYVQTGKPIRSPDVDEIIVRWHALRATFGKEREACEYINLMGGEAYCPIIRNVKMVKGKRKKVVESYIPNLLFARGSIDYLKGFVYDDAHLSYLRFYDGYREVCGIMQRRPLFIPDKQMVFLKTVCEAENGGTFFPNEKAHVFKAGDWVRVKQGSRFAGVEGQVARYKGQRCVAVMVEGLLNFATAYIPDFLLEPLYKK